MNDLRLPRGRVLALVRTPVVMGILNITPDSFSDGGVHFDHTKAVHAAMQMEEDGAAIIDIGGESTRPGAEPISDQIEMDRVLPVIEQIRRRSDVPLSIDTRKSSVAKAAIAAGADIINDVSALRSSPGMAPLAALAQVPVILMHMRGEPSTMQQHAHYDDVVRDVRHHPEVVSDDDDRGPELLLEVLHQVENLSLDRHVERGGRLVRNQELGVVDQGHRDHGSRRVAQGVHRPSHRPRRRPGTDDRFARRGRRRPSRGRCHCSGPRCSRNRRFPEGFDGDHGEGSMIPEGANP